MKQIWLKTILFTVGLNATFQRVMHVAAEKAENRRLTMVDAVALMELVVIHDPSPTLTLAYDSHALGAELLRGTRRRISVRTSSPSTRFAYDDDGEERWRLRLLWLLVWGGVVAAGTCVCGEWFVTVTTRQ
jgi:hypothetical protein